MKLIFDRIAHGPAWERWAVFEPQNEDAVFAGEAILTYSDLTSYADVVCSVLINRQLNEAEIEDVLSATTSILSGRGGVSVFFAEELATKTFDVSEPDEETSTD